MSASKRKISQARKFHLTQEQCDVDQVWFIMNIAMLNKLIGEVLCPTCPSDTLEVCTMPEARNGFTSKLKLCCFGRQCNFSTETYTSPRSQYCGQNTSEEMASFEINKRMVLYSHEIGSSNSALGKFSKVPGIPNMHLKTFQQHSKRLSTVQTHCGQLSLTQPVDEVRQAYIDTDEDLLEQLQNGENPTIDISVAFDGTRHNRGFISLYGIGTVTDVITGLVLDFKVLSKYCHACKLAQNKYAGPELEAWKQNHESDCCINHTESSKSMEAKAVEIMWLRSVEKHGFPYTQMLCDGDSTAYKRVCDSNVYGDIAVEKLECVNHAHRRMGTALRKLSKEERLGGRGIGRLTDEKCETLQYYQRGAILNNLNDMEGMKKAIWARLWHCMSTDKQPRHHLCPKGADSWCFYQLALDSDSTPPSHAEHMTSAYLKADVATKLIPIYQRMSDMNRLKRMRHGSTQNVNECMNSLIWLHCPKTLFFGKGRIEAAVSRAVCIFNEGTLSVMNVVDRLYLDISTVTLQSCLETDKRRLSKTQENNSVDYKRKRKQSAGLKLQERREEENREGTTYGVGIAE